MAQPAATVPEPRPLPQEATKRIPWVGIAVAVAAVTCVVVLATVPVGQRADFRQDLAVGPGGHGVFSGWIFPTGMTVFVTWKTTPFTNISLRVNMTKGYGYNQTPVFGANGTFGNATIYSTGEIYGFDVHNRQNQLTTVTFSAYYQFNAPLL